MKKIQFFNPFIIAILLLLVTNCKKTDETLPANPGSVVSANAASSNAASSVKNSGIIATASSVTTPQNKAVIIPPPTVAAPLGGPPQLSVHQ